jgi:hypothetical protein
MQVIIYKEDNGRLAIISPAPEYVISHGLDLIAQKDVPAGKPYKIVDASVIPPDGPSRDAWTCDDADLTDGVGAEWNLFPEEA